MPTYTPEMVQARLREIRAQKAAGTPLAPVSTSTSPTIKPTPEQVRARLAEIRAQKAQQTQTQPITPQNPTPPEEGILSKVGGALANVARGIIKPIAQTPVQFGRSFMSGIYGLAGNQEKRNELLKPVTVPVLGEVKTPSADPRDVQYGAQSGMESLGQSAEIASTLIGAGGAGSVVKQGAKGAIKQTIKTGIREGALSGAFSGMGSELKKDKEATVGGIFKSTLGGAALGGVIGGVGGALGPVLTKEGRAAMSIRKAEGEALDVVMPKMTNKVKEQALSEGRIASKGLLKKQVVLASKEDKAVANSVTGLVSKNAQPVENVNAIRSGIKDVAESHVRPVLETNPRPYNMNTFKTRVNDLKMPTLFKADPAMEKTYRLVQERAAEIASQYPKTKLGLWQARQEFDQAVEKEFPRVFDGSTQDTVIKHAVKDVRGAWNDFISEGLPEGNGVKESFKQMSRMYQAIDNISEKNAGNVGTNMLERITKKHPLLKKAVGYGAAAGAGALGLKGVSEFTK